MGAKSQGFTFYIQTPSEVSGKPTRQNFTNQFDYLGSLVSLERNKDESSSDYKDRLYDTTVHPGDSLYEGCVNNISRAFGLLRETALTISLKTNSSGNNIADNPRVDILADRIILYSDWQPNGTETIDSEILFYDIDDDVFYLSDLVSKINESTCFSASLASNVRSNLHSTNLIRTSSYFRIRGDLIEGTTKTKLSSINIVENSLVFDESDIFKTEVTTTPSTAGEYYVDYINGEIETFTIPSGALEVSYHYNIFPLIVDYSPIKIYTLNDDYFKNKLFYKETLDSGEEINGLPNPEGSEILHQLHMETKHLWGE